MSDPIIPYGIKFPEVYLKGREAARAYAFENGYSEDGFMEVQAQWSDQDSNKHVTNTVYFKWAEAGRLWFIAALFKSFPAPIATQFRGVGVGKGLILGFLSNSYLRPSFWPDTVLVAHKLIEVKERKFKMEYMIYSYEQQAQVGKGEAVLAAYDYDALTSCALTTEVIAALRSRMPDSPPLAKL